MKKKKRYTIGLLNYGTSDPNSLILWSGVNDIIKEYDLNLICFPANPIRSPHGFDYQANVLYDLVSKESIDGLVFWAALLSFNCGYDEIKNFHLRYKPLPIVCLTMKMDGIPSVLVDGYQGMRLLVEHFVKVHGYKHIAYIRGPITYTEEHDRFRAYKDVLKENNILFDENLIASGDFKIPSGANAVKLFIDERKVNLDAIIAANDVSAIDVIDALHERDIQVPRQIAVGGFDDIIECGLVTPALTTVKQMFDIQGKLTTEMLLSILKGGETPDDILLPTKLVVRQSCGCMNPIITLASTGNLYIPSISKNLPDTIKCKDIITEISMEIGSIELEYNWAEEILNTFLDDIKNNKSTLFLSSMNKILDQMVIKDVEISSWHGVLSKLRYCLLPFLNPVQLTNAENLWQQARVMIGEVIRQVEGYKRIQFESQNQKVLEFSHELISTFNIDDLMKIVAEKLPSFGIIKCYLSLYEDPSLPTVWSRLVLAYDEKGVIKIDPEGIRFPSKMLIPEGLLDKKNKYSLIVEPLYFREEQIGFVLFEAIPKKGKIFDLLRVQISSALKGAILVKKIDMHISEINGSKAQLEKTYSDLKENQEKLIATEKMAVLGRLTAGIAHEINTPLAAIRASIVELNALIEEYEQSIGNPEILPEDHKSIVGDMKRYLYMIKISAEKSAGFIRGIKSQTINFDSKTSVPFIINPIVADTLGLLSFEIRHNNCILETDIDDDILLLGDPRELSQIITNLVNNAIDACSDGGVISLSIKRIEENIVLMKIKDTGSGIAEENLSKLFNTKFTTKPFGKGTGLGLSIVSDLVKEFKGQIEVKSKPGETIFSIKFPLQIKK